MKIRIILTTMLLGIGLIAFAQKKGIVSGHVKEKGTGEDVIGGNVLIEGTALGTSTDIRGNFSFPIEAGTYKLVVTYIGFQKLVVESLEVKAGEEVKIELQLDPENQELQEIVVTGTADRASESHLMVERKNAVEILQAIGTQELSRKGISDAEAAVTQVVGVTKQEGAKNVFVRGLGDRYNSTSLNGLPLPSEDPQYKNIALSFFSTDIIDNIGVNKTFTSNIDGDVSGANINIVSKKLFEDHEFSISGSIGANSLAVSHDFYRADGNNFVGSVDKEIPITNLDQFTFNNSLSPKQLGGSAVNPSLSLSGGKSFNVGNGTLKLFVVAAMNSDYLYKEGISRQTTTVGDYRQDFRYKKYEYNVTQFTLGNLTYGFGNNNSIAYNLIYIHDNKQYIADYKGFSLNAVDDPTEPNAYDALVRRQQTNNNTLWVNQLTSEFNLTNKLSLDVKGSFNTIRGDEPDRRQNWLIGDGNGENYVAVNSSPAYNHRFFSTLKEDEVAGNIALNYKLKGASKIVVGYNFRGTSRNFDYVQFNFDHLGAQSVDPKNPDAFYNQESLDNGYFNLETGKGNNADALDPFFYTGDRQINSGFAHFVYEVNSNLSVILGTRMQNFQQEVTWSVGADEIRPDIPGDNTVKTNKNYFLPSLNMKYSLTDNDQLRFSSSRTFTFPQFKEVAPFLYEDVTGNTFGNPNLVPSESINIDLKFEHYFSGTGLIAFSGYYKFIKNSINKVLANSAALEYSYYNTGNANVVGGELEFRKKLFSLSRAENAGFLSSGVNVSYLYAVQGLDGGVEFSATHSKSGLEGASPLLINSDLTFTKNSTKGNKITSAVVLNYFSKRIYSLGTMGQNDIYERGIPTLDLISKFELSHRFTLSVNFKNLLNPEYRQTKEVLDTGEDDILNTYRKGMTSSVGFTYKL